MSAPTLVDARGMRCPWPALRLARAMREQGDVATIHILADDPAAPAEIAALAEGNGWAFSIFQCDEGPRYTLSRQPTVYRSRA